MYNCIHDLHVLCHVVKLCYIRDMGRWIFHQTDNNGQVGFWPNDSNGTKWVIQTDINDSNSRVVIVTAIHLEFSPSQVQRLSTRDGAIMNILHSDHFNTHLVLHCFIDVFSPGVFV